MTTKRLCVKWEDGMRNIPITHIEKDSGYMVAYMGDQVVGAFDVSFVQVMYVSEAKTS